MRSVLEAKPSNACRVAARLRAALMASTALLASALSAQAQQAWTGATSTDWFDATNWTPNTVPANGDQPTIDTTTPNAPVIDGATAPAPPPVGGSYPQIFIGENATGTLTIQNAGTLNADNAFIGDNAGSNGTVTMTGASIWNSTGTSNGTIVGFNGTGTFNVNGGSTVNSANTILGFGAASSGTVTVDGAGSIWKQTGAAPLSALFVGYGGTGDFTASTGGQVQAVDTYVGHLAGSNGTATVTGAGSTWTGSGSIFVGNSGTGTFNVLGGGAATSTLDTNLGYNTGSTGTIKVDGAGSTWTANRDIVVGGNGNNQPGGTGIFNVQNGGVVNANNDTVLSASAGATGTVTVTDATSQWLAANKIYIGGVGTGTFNVLNGGSVTANGNTFIGNFAGSSGTLNVGGTGSKWTSAAGTSFYVGDSGTGEVKITNRGLVINNSAFVGDKSGSTGTVTIDGTGSEWRLNGNSVIGGNTGTTAAGTGTVNVQNGATFNANAVLLLGNSSNGTGNGTLNVSGGSTWNSTDVAVGEEATGTVNITGGSVATVTGALFVGDCACANGTVTVSGANSQFHSTTIGANNVAIGFDGTGTFKVLNGAAADFTTDVYLGRDAGSSGTLNVESAGTFSTTRGLILGFGGTGTATVSGALSTLTVGTTTRIGGSGDGTLNVLSGATAGLRSIFVGTGTGQGTLKIDSISSATGSGYAQGGTGTFNVGISPTGNGKVAITGGNIDLTNAGALVVNAKTTQAKKYDIMTTDGTVFWTTGFSSVSVVGNANNLQVAYNVPCGALNCVELSVDTFSLANVLPPGTSGNAGNVAGALDKAITSGLTIPDAFFDVFALSGANLVNALAQLSGEPAAGATQSNTQLMNSFLSLLLNPYGGAPGGNPAALSYAREFGPGEKVSPAAAAAYAAVTPKDKRADPFAARWGVWGQAYGGYNKTDGNTTAGSHDSTARTYGLATGFDYRVSGDTVVGFALAGAGESWGLSDGLGGGRGDALQLGAYGSKRFGAAYVSGALSYAVHNITTDRTITVSGSDHLTANFTAQSVGGRLETGYRFQTPYAGVTPYAAVQVQDFFTPSYSENAVSGSNVFALSYGSRSTVATRTELGAWFDKMTALEQGNVLSLRLRAAWANDHQSNQDIGATFQTLPGASFTVNGAAPATNLALLTAGAELRLANNVSVGAKVDGEFASRSQTYAGTGTVRYVW